MREVVKAGIGILAAFLLYTALGKINHSLPLMVNFFSLLVIYFALGKGEVYGACMGTVSGLIQDSFSLGVFGISGMAKTITGYVAGYVSQKIDVVPFFRNFLFIMTMMIIEVGISYLLYSFIYPEYVREINPFLSFQPLSTALVGSLIFVVVKRFWRLSP
ncbi:MAG: rod shape-determining protein MreD [Candidatus Aminicenantales bacterium]